jgi:hypothetical protein
MNIQVFTVDPVLLAEILRTTYSKTKKAPTMEPFFVGVDGFEPPTLCL